MEHPILFSGEMVRTVVEGRKTQTRRIVKPQPEYENGHVYWWKGDPGNGEATWTIGEIVEHCPYGQIGDKLWVREAWMLYNQMGTFIGNIPKQQPKDLSVGYKADGLDKDNLFTWRSPIFMPKWAARIWLEITSIRVERVQEISELDAEAEGIRSCFQHSPHHKVRASFSLLWDSLNAKRGYGWEKNPWVWVIEFERVCRICGCTDSRACAGGCSWAAPSLCSRCAKEGDK